MKNFQSDLYGRTGTVQVRSGMSIDSHLERCLLVQTAELYSPGKYVNWNLSIFNGKPMIAMENFQSDLSVRTGTVQVKSGMSIDSHLERCLLVQTAELYSTGKYVNWNLSIFNGKPMIAMENFQSDLSGRTGTVQVKSGMSIDSHLERCLLVQTAELYSPGKYVNWNLSIFNGKPMIAMENFQSDLSGRTGTVQVKSGMSIDSHLERCLWSKQQSCTVLGSMLTEI